jgi:hypothetical protein
MRWGCHGSGDRPVADPVPHAQLAQGPRGLVARLNAIAAVPEGGRAVLEREERLHFAQGMVQA